MITLNREQRRALMKQVPAKHDVVLCAVSERGEIEIDCLRDMYVRTDESKRDDLIDQYRELIAKIDSGEVILDREKRAQEDEEV